uniref:Transposase n=1 Tax=Heterorhabditis bacteriophora TaxID=37862 RepID=A0A1I7WWQ3_HETBA
MSGPIRSIIGPIHKRLLKIIESYKTDATQFLTPLGAIDNNNLL